MKSDCSRVVMIVEDDPDAREIIADLIAEEGYSPLVAANGRDALAALDEAKGDTLPCVILLDMMMPVLDGWEFRAAQESDPAIAEIPVVVLSAHVDVRSAAETMRAAGFMRKPIDFRALIRLIERHCAPSS